MKAGPADVAVRWGPKGLDRLHVKTGTVWTFHAGKLGDWECFWSLALRRLEPWEHYDTHHKEPQVRRNPQDGQWEWRVWDILNGESYGKMGADPDEGTALAQALEASGISKKDWRK